MSSETLELRALPGFDLIKKRYPIGYLFFIKESARRDSNPRPRPWQGRAPPTEPLAHICYLFVVLSSTNSTIQESAQNVNLFLRKK